MHALNVTSRPKLYIFNVTLTPVSLFLNLCSSEIRVNAKWEARVVQQLLQFSSSTFRFFDRNTSMPLSRVSGSLAVGLRSRQLSKKFFPTGQRSLECQGTWVLVPRVFAFLLNATSTRQTDRLKHPIASYQSVRRLADCSAESWSPRCC